MGRTNTPFCQHLSCPARKLQRRTTERIPHNHHLLPGESFTQTCAERLNKGFFGSKTGGKMWSRIFFLQCVLPFISTENPFQDFIVRLEKLAKAFDPGQIGSGADNCRRSAVQQG